MGIKIINNEIRKKSDSISIRVDQRNFNFLEEVKQNTGKNNSTIINEMLSEYVNWKEIAKNSEFISLPKSLLIRTLEFLPDKKILDIAHDHVDSGEGDDIMYTALKEHTAEEMANLLQNWAKSNNINSKINISKNEYILTFYLKMEEKWTLLISEVFRYAFEKYFNKITTTKNSKNNFILNIKM